jgi:putative N6-adenine-specific DNA methylase
MSRLAAYIVTAPGLEQVTAAEMARLDMKVVDLGVGGLTASITWSQLMLAHLHLRTATRILIRIGRFEASGFGDLQAGLRDIPFHEWLPKRCALNLSVSSSGSRLNHTGAIEERVRAVVKRAYDPAFEYEGGVHTMHVRISRNIATVSIDATGDPLYQRGWRTEAGPAPLRETLAAALLQWSGATAYKGVLTDPCCGAGTIMIEAAQIARRMPAGRHRSFAFENWMPVDPAQWAKLLAASDADIRGPLKKKYVARDIKGEMVDKARANAERAGVLDDIVFEVGDATRTLTADGGAGFAVVTNPPYGERLSAAGHRSLYLALGKAERLAAIAPASSIASFKREFDDALATSNGGLAVRFVRVAFSR